MGGEEGVRLVMDGRRGRGCGGRRKSDWDSMCMYHPVYSV